jgi:pimeloyl-ACP methyl ester carboxylesterase
MEAQERYRQTVHLDDGTCLSALVQPGEGPAFVLMPGSGGNAHSFDHFLPLLDPELALNVVLPDLRGQGESWPPPVPGMGRIEQFSDDVLRLIDSLGIGHFYVGGKSIGGMVAIDMLRVCPERIRGVISMEGFTHHTVLEEALGGDMFSTLTRAQLEEMRRAGKERRSRWTEEEREEFPKIWKRWQHGYELLLRTDKPVLEIWGDRGRPRPSLELMQIPERRNIEVHWIENTSHSFINERPEEVASIVNDFIRRVETGRV